MKKFFVTIIILLIYISLSFCQLLKLFFLDVGQGDSTFIITPTSKTILIDAGDCDELRDYGKNVVRFIKNFGFKKIDVVIMSHPHRDHIGGLIYVLSNIEVKKFYDPGFAYPSSVYQEVLECVKKNNIKYHLARNNVNISLDKTVEISILYPPEKLLYDTPNNNSCVVRLKYKNISVLFTGDIEKEAEKEIVKLYKENPNKIVANVLKIPHHGSTTSSTEEFINLINPEAGIIFCGKNNRFGHPKKKVLELYEDLGIEIYQTDILGTIQVEIDGDDYQIKPFKEH